MDNCTPDYGATMRMALALKKHLGDDNAIIDFSTDNIMVRGSPALPSRPDAWFLITRETLRVMAQAVMEGP